MLLKLVKIIKPIVLIEYENRKRYFSTKPFLRKFLLSKQDRSKYLWRNSLDVFGRLSNFLENSFDED
jgi:hypothetical protein